MPGLHSEMLEIFREDLPQSERAQQIYFAFCNNLWQSSDRTLEFSWRAAGEFVAGLRNDLGLSPEDPDLCQRCNQQRDDHYQIERKLTFSLIGGEDVIVHRPYCDAAGEHAFISGYTGTEDYMDYYCLGGEGEVETWVAEKLEQHGYQRINN